MLSIDNFEPYGFEAEIETWNRPDMINLSDITDKIIRLAAKDTERFAGDAVISLNSMQKEITEWDFTADSRTWLYGFRESGVDHLEWVLNSNIRQLPSRYRSIWRVDLSSHADYPDNITVKLYRVQYRARNEI